MFKLSVFTVATPDLEPAELCAVARAAGIQGVEWRCKETPPERIAEPPSFWGNNRCTIPPDASEEQATRIRDLASASGLTNLALVPYLTCGDVEETEARFRLAASLGCGMVRIGVPAYNERVRYPEQLEAAYAYMDQVDELARDYGVKALVETHHGTIAASASAAWRLVSRYSPERFGVLYDPGNMIHEGMEEWRLGVEVLGPYLAHVHVKNAAWAQVALSESGETMPFAAAASGDEAEPDPLAPAEWKCDWWPIASGIVPWKRVLSALKSVGYDGWLGVEDFSRTYGSRELLQTFVRQIRAWEEERS
ncbi:sugar phosphate isomerase/epimerase family protein [Cohnella massiliensis]|uniref:sugar phosphate isomerase/epimerase family protein n=1 Tax=Cohnella massiliensis TaxID=1816691 RepID=UPI0009B96E21|nr:sugar phosphate isomerase/epimerase family protein [Cohnella massiliensis]